MLPIILVKEWSTDTSGCPIPGGAQGQVGWGPEKPDRVGGSPAHSRGLEWMIFKVLSNQSHSMIL